MNTMEVIVPQLGVNDETVCVTKWCVLPGDFVRRGQDIAVIETTKAAFDLEAEYDGYCYPIVKEGDRVSIRAVVALITSQPDPNAVARYTAALPAGPPAQNSKMPQLTRDAQNLLEAHRIDPALLPTDRIVRAQDVRALIKQRAPASPEPHRSGDGIRQVAIYGAAQGGLAVAECLSALGGYDIVCMLDDREALIDTVYSGIPVISGKELESLREKGVDAVATHIADPSARLSIRERAHRTGLEALTVVHPRASVAASAQIGEACLIKAGAIIDAHVRIGDCCIIDNGVILPHHNRIGAGCHLAPGACFGGDCTVGDGTVIGIGAVIAARIQIGSKVIVGAGACVCRDLPDGVVVEGNSSRIIGARR